MADYPLCARPKKGGVGQTIIVVTGAADEALHILGGLDVIEILALVAFLALVAVWFALPSKSPVSIARAEHVELAESAGSLAAAQA